MRICLVLEGSYPYSYGGVSSWADQLIRSMPDDEFVLFTIFPTSDRRQKFAYKLPDNVVGVEEMFFDIPLHLVPRRRYRFHFSDEEKTEIMKMLECGDPDWEVVIDAFRRQKFTPPAFLMSREFMDMFSQLIGHVFPRAPFTDTFYMERSMILPVLYLIGAHVPDADLYHAVCTGYAGLLTVVAGHVKHKPICLTEHGIYSREREEELIRTDWTTPDFKEQWIRFYYMLSTAIYKRASCVTALFHGAMKTQIELGAPAGLCRVIANGVDYQKFSRAVPKKPDGIIDIGAAVRFSKIKDIKTMIYAFYRVWQERQDVRLHILGPDEDADYAKECRELVKDLGMNDVILMPGRISDMVGYYGKLDFVILTSLSEGQPLCILEAMAAGRPGVTTDVGCCRELIYGAPGDNFGQAGYIARPMDPADIAAQILHLAARPDQIAEFGENGRRRVEALYQRSQMIENYKRMYQEVNHGGHRL